VEPGVQPGSFAADQAAGRGFGLPLSAAAPAPLALLFVMFVVILTSGCEAKLMKIVPAIRSEGSVTGLVEGPNV
jgi:hypothetical protein